jgi:anti-anti-sigma factor
VTTGKPYGSSEHPSSHAVVITGDDGVVIRLFGEIDRFTAVPLFAEVHTVVVANPARHLVLDLDGVDFCDVGGIRALTCLAAAIGAHGSTFCLRGVRPEVAWLMGALGVADLLHRGSARP